MYDVYDGIHHTPDYQDNGIMFLSVENISTLTSDKFVSRDFFEQNYKIFPEKGDILLTRIGNVGTPNVVESTDKLAYYVSLALLKAPKINSYFLCNLICTQEFKKELHRKTLTTAIPQKINKDEIRKITFFDSTSSDERKKIGSLLEKINFTITLHEEKKHQLESLKSALLQKMFADKSGYPSVRFKKYNSTWVLRRIIDLLNQTITDGPHETPCLVGKGIPFISADAIVNNKIDFSRKRGNITKEYDLVCCKKYRPQMHDIFLVKSGSTVGKVAIVETTTRFNIWSPLAALRCGEKSDPYFVFFLMQTEKFQTQVKNKASNGTQPNLSMRALECFKVIVSIELNEQQAIGYLFKKLNELIDLHQHKIDNLIAVKQSLLQNMFI
ncbi:restriction endonuclease subunit S [Lactobacillus delbrueckii]|uniref:restriction endonuclease subunit S n=1 Tax=Lactobacillus delbrueckii TaxID=1584 RepID=UPI003A87E1F9